VNYPCARAEAISKGDATWIRMLCDAAGAPIIRDRLAERDEAKDPIFPFI